MPLHTVQIVTESQREKCVFKPVVQRLEIRTSTVYPKPLGKSPGVFRSQQAPVFELLQPKQAESVWNNQHIAWIRTSSASPSSPDRGQTFQIMKKNPSQHSRDVSFTNVGRIASQKAWLFDPSSPKSQIRALQRLSFSHSRRLCKIWTKSLRAYPQTTWKHCAPRSLVWGHNYQMVNF